MHRLKTLKNRSIEECSWITRTLSGRGCSTSTSTTAGSSFIDGGPAKLLSQNVRGLGLSPTVATNDLQRALKAQGKPVLSMGFGQSPFPVPESMVERMRDHARDKDYLLARGLPELRQAIAKFHNGLYQPEESVTMEDVFIAPGTKDAMFLLQLSYYGELLLPSPSWVSYEPQAQIIGRPVRWLPTSADQHWKLTGEQLAKELDRDPNKPRVLILNSPSNPTGVSYNADELRALARECRRHNVIVISDEIYAPLYFSDQSHPPSMSSFYPEGTVVTTGVSKWAGAGGWRLGCMIFPRSLRWLMDAMASVASETFTCVSAPIQAGCVPAFDEFESSEMQDYLTCSRRTLGCLARYAFDELSKTGAIVVPPQGGFYLFPDFTPVSDTIDSMRQRWMDEQKSSDLSYGSIEFSHQLMRESGVCGLSGAYFGRPSDEFSIRLSFVDFDGGLVLERASEMPDNADDPSSKEMLEFCKKYTPRVIEAVDSLRNHFNGK